MRMRPACSEKSACSVASANSSVGGSTATLGNDLSSLTISEDFPVDIEMTSVNGNSYQLFLLIIMSFNYCNFLF